MTLNKKEEFYRDIILSVVFIILFLIFYLRDGHFGYIFLGVFIYFAVGAISYPISEYIDKYRWERYMKKESKNKEFNEKEEQ